MTFLQYIMSTSKGLCAIWFKHCIIILFHKLEKNQYDNSGRMNYRFYNFLLSVTLSYIFRKRVYDINFGEKR